MKKVDNIGAAVDAATITSLRSSWFQRIEHLHQSIAQQSGLECAARCTARCCPKAKALSRVDEPVGHVAIMLPFEREYILSHTNIDSELLGRDRIPFTANTTLSIGFMTSEVPCPFLTDDNQCGIYDVRPLDCRSFPLIPVFHQQGSISFRVDDTCPLATTFSIAYQEELKDLWEELLPHLPMSYRFLYNEL